MQSGRFGEAQVIPQALDLNFKNWFGNTCASKAQVCFGAIWPKYILQVLSTNYLSVKFRVSNEKGYTYTSLVYNKWNNALQDCSGTMLIDTAFYRAVKYV